MKSSHLSRPIGPRATAKFGLSLVAVLILGGCAGTETSGLNLADKGTSAPGDKNGANPSWSARENHTSNMDFRVTPKAAALIKQARELRAAGKKDQALALLNEAPAANTNPALIKERGLLAAELGKLDDAEKLLRKAIDPKAPDWRVYSALGATLSAGGKQNAARTELNKALALAPDHPSVLNNLALTYVKDGNKEEAKRILKTASSQNGVHAARNLAIMQGSNGSPAQAAHRGAGNTTPTSKVAYTARMKPGSVKLSKANAGDASYIRSADARGKEDKPIMQLGSSY